MNEEVADEQAPSDDSDDEQAPSDDEGDERRATKRARAASPTPSDAASDETVPTTTECVECDAPFPDRWRTMKRHGKDVEVLVLRVDADGGAWGGCSQTCANRCVDVERFAPAAATRSNGKRRRFLAALDELRAAARNGDGDAVQKLRAEVERLRADACNACSKRNEKLSPAVRACLDEWDRMRQEKCREQDGCANEGCPERGMAAWIGLTADHGTNPKRHNLSQYLWWASRGGVRAMREEAERIQKWICFCCHALEPTSASGRVNDPETMERKPDETEHKFKQRVWMAKITFPKYEHVNARKRAIGACQYPGCGRKVVRGNEASFGFDHRDEATKRKCRCVNKKGEARGACHGCADKLFGRVGGVSGLAHNHAKAATLARVEGLLDAEMDKCDLLCHNCHISRKPLGLARHDVYERPAAPPPRAPSQTPNAIYKRERKAAKQR